MPVKVINGWDERTQCLVTISASNIRTIDGTTYGFNEYIPLLYTAPDNVTNFAFTTPVDKIITMSNPYLSSDMNFYRLQFYEDGSFTDGTLKDTINYNRNVGDNSSLSIYQDATIDTTASKLLFQILTIGGGGNKANQVGSGQSFESYFILKPATTYIIYIINDSTVSDDGNGYIDLTWTEEEI